MNKKIQEAKAMAERLAKKLGQFDYCTGDDAKRDRLWELRRQANEIDAILTNLYNEDISYWKIYGESQ